MHFLEGGAGGAGGVGGVLDQTQKDVPGRTFLAGVAAQHRNRGRQLQGLANFVGGVLERGALELVDGDDERDSALLEEGDDVEAVGEAAGVGQDDRTESTQRQVVPDIEEARLPGGAEKQKLHVLQGRVIRPKSMATVVVVFASTPARLSVLVLAVVIVSSVLSGAISLTAPTIVLLPAPNPPATTIFKDFSAGRCSAGELFA